MKKYLKFEFIGMIFCAILGICCLSVLFYGIFLEKSIAIIIIFLLNSIAMLLNSIACYMNWKTSIQFDNYSKLEQDILSNLKKVSEVELDPFADTHTEIDSNQGGPMNAWRFNDDNESNIKHYTNLKKFKGLVIPKGITFVKHKYVESLVGDKRTPCDVLTNGGIDVDPWEGVKCENKNCFGISCCDCIFFDQNADQRAEYFKQLQKENQDD